jgi:NAD(P)H-hydrate repair Nnr-like enzyme with NAD(P)H-hydrate epimerase domain
LRESQDKRRDQQDDFPDAATASSEEEAEPSQEESPEPEPAPAPTVKLVGWKSSLNGVLVPSVTAAEMSEIDALHLKSLGFHASTLVECAGHALAGFTLQMAGPRRLHPKNLKRNGCDVVLLVGNHRKGAYALCAGRHLALRGVNVAVLIVKRSVVVGEPVQLHAPVHGAADSLVPSSSHSIQKIIDALDARPLKTSFAASQFQGLDPLILHHLHLFFVAGGEFLHGVGDLPQPAVAPVDFIVDALLDSDTDTPPSMLALQFSRTSALCRAIEWANTNKATVISVDVPSGLDATTGKLLAHVAAAAPATPTTPHHHHLFTPHSPGGMHGGSANGSINILAALFGSAAISKQPDVDTETDLARVVVLPKYTLAIGLPKLGLLQRARLRDDQRKSNNNLSASRVNTGISTSIITTAARRTSSLDVAAGGVSTSVVDIGEVYLLDAGWSPSAVRQVLDADADAGREGRRRAESLAKKVTVSAVTDAERMVVVADEYAVPFGDRFFVKLESVEVEQAV